MSEPPVVSDDSATRADNIGLDHGSDEGVDAGSESAAVLTLLLYSDDRTVREAVRFALGRRVARDLPPVRVLEVATAPAVTNTMDEGGIDLAILDGEAVPGGMGICRGLKDELPDCPPVLLLTGRTDDAWLATWSRADAALAHPVDAVRLPEVVAAMLRAPRARNVVPV